MDRAEHLEWAKKRAHEKQSGLEAWASFINDLGKHDDLEDHIAIELGNAVLGAQMFDTEETMKFIDGFN